MSAYRYHSSRPDSWTQPRPTCDASQRFMTYGPIRPMDEKRGLLSRLLGIG